MKLPWWAVLALASGLALVIVVGALTWERDPLWGMLSLGVAAGLVSIVWSPRFFTASAPLHGRERYVWPVALALIQVPLAFSASFFLGEDTFRNMAFLNGMAGIVILIDLIVVLGFVAKSLGDDRALAGPAAGIGLFCFLSIGGLWDPLESTSLGVFALVAGVSIWAMIAEAGAGPRI